MGHHILSPRFVGNVHMAYMPAPLPDELVDVAGAMLGPVVAALNLPPSSRWGSLSATGVLADAMVAAYSLVRGMFAADER